MKHFGKLFLIKFNRSGLISIFLIFKIVSLHLKIINCLLIQINDNDSCQILNNCTDFHSPCLVNNTNIACKIVNNNFTKLHTNYTINCSSNLTFDKNDVYDCYLNNGLNEEKYKLHIDYCSNNYNSTQLYKTTPINLNIFQSSLTSSNHSKILPTTSIIFALNSPILLNTPIYNNTPTFPFTSSDIKNTNNQIKLTETSNQICITFIKNCEAGFKGIDCSELICTTETCLNNGSCIFDRINNDYKCQCSNFYIGDHCEIECGNQDCSGVAFNEQRLADLSSSNNDPVTNAPSNIPLIVGLSVGIPLGVIAIIVAICVILYIRKRRATAGLYKPSEQEIEGSRNNMNNVLQLPPEERLI